jgi:hypothetical protein
VAGRYEAGGLEGWRTGLTGRLADPVRSIRGSRRRHWTVLQCASSSNVKIPAAAAAMTTDTINTNSFSDSFWR